MTLNALVVGAGQAGLAMGRELQKRGLRFLILDGAPKIGHTWRSRWESLKLFTPARYDSLPDLPFPGDGDGYPGKDDVASYLQTYTRTFDLPVRTASRVLSVTPAGGGFEAKTEHETIEAAAVVVATGPFQVPWTPPAAGALDQAVFQVHSAGYRNPESTPGSPTLVVGGGNSGFQIAEELAATREVHLSVGSRNRSLPQRFLGRDLFWWLTRTGLIRKTAASRVGRRMRQSDALIGVSERRVRRLGVRIRPRLVEAGGRDVRFANGSTLAVGSVVWATGYRPDHSWLEVPAAFDETGRVRHRRGVTDATGVYLVGQSWQHTRASALLLGVGEDAAYLAGRIAAGPSGLAPGPNGLLGWR